MTRLAGVIGDPIGHSLSPRLHGHWLSRYGIDGQYVPLRVPKTELDTILRLLPQMGFQGVNVTIPHKEAVFALSHERTARAEAVAAANTLTFRDGRIHADNTDGLGFIRSLRAGAPAWPQDRTGLIFGAGGAARGIVASLLEAGLPHIVIANRTVARGEDLAAHFGSRVSALALDDVSGVMSDLGLIVNTTSLGMDGQPPLRIDLTDVPKDAIVSDIVYTPLRTPLLAQAHERGNPTVDGLGMLLHQAAPGFEQWFGTCPEVDDTLRQAVLAR